MTLYSTALSAKLQQDLQALEQWESEWDMQFHPNKCSILHVTRRTAAKLLPKYSLRHQNLQHVKTAKYLGVTIQDNGKWDTHISSVAAKANQALGFVRRSLKTTQRRTKELAYKALVRPHLEYAASVWDPSSEKHTKELEAVQRRAARYVLNDYRKTSSVTDMYHKLNWPSLENRRTATRLTTLYKIHHNQLKVHCKDPHPLETRSRRSHS